MEVTEDQVIEKHANQSMHSLRNRFLPFENEWTCFFM